MRLLYSTRSPTTLLYASELARRAKDPDPASAVTVLYTRKHLTASQASGPTHRLGHRRVRPTAAAGDALLRVRFDGIVEASIEHLITAGFASDNIRAERFG